MKEMLKGTIASRLAGDKPSPVKAVIVSTVVGIAVAVMTYRVLRS